MDYIAQLADYGVAKGLIHESDRNYAINALLEVMGMDEPGEDPACPAAGGIVKSPDRRCRGPGPLPG